MPQLPGGSRIHLHRDNMVPCVRCEPIYKLMESLELAIEMIRDEGKHQY